jgi:FtsH-binding integral membrane protein
MFWQNSALQFLISVVGVIVFNGPDGLGHAQRLKQMATQIPRDKLRLLRDPGRAGRST